jgi:hypothetical protein
MLLNKKIYVFGLMILFCFASQHSVNGMQQQNNASENFGGFCANAFQALYQQENLSKKNQENNKVMNFMEKLGRWSGKLLTKVVKYSLPSVPKEGVCSKKFLIIVLLYCFVYLGIYPHLGLIADILLKIGASGCINSCKSLGFVNDVCINIGSLLLEKVGFKI